MTSRDRASDRQSFDLIANGGQKLRSSDRPQIKILLWNPLMLISKWYSKSKLDENCGFFDKRKVSISIFSKIFISTNNKIPHFPSNFDLAYHFEISISWFYNKILIWGRFNDLNFWPPLAMRSKLWRLVALSLEVTETSNLACDILTPTHNYGLRISLIFQNNFILAHLTSGIYCRKSWKS